MPTILGNRCRARVRAFGDSRSVLGFYKTDGKRAKQLEDIPSIQELRHKQELHILAVVYLGLPFEVRRVVLGILEPNVEEGLRECLKSMGYNGFGTSAKLGTKEVGESIRDINRRFDAELNILRSILRKGREMAISKGNLNPRQN